MDELAAYFSNDDSPKTILPAKDLRCRTNVHKNCRYGALRRCSTDTAGICTMEKSWQEDVDGANGTTNATSDIGGVANGFKPRDATSRCRTISTNSGMSKHLPPEVEMGNIEYKRKLVDPTPNRFEHLVTQMKWRLNEGDGEAIYRLGVDDDGNISGLSPNELTPSLRTLTRMAHRLNATVKPLREWIVDPAICSDESLTPNAHSRGEHRKAVELLIRQLPTINQGKPNICIAVLGGVDAGKSTLIGVLTDGELDNGRGRARLNLFRHPHEVQSGRTSSLSSQLLGFDSSGNVLNYRRTDGRLERCSVEEVVRKSAQLVTLLDLAGLAKYQRTTLSGLSRTQPVGVLLVVSATTGLTSVGLEHAQLAISLGLPLGVVISKIDAVLDTTDRSKHVRLVYNQILQRIKQLRLRVPSVPDFGAPRDPSPTGEVKSIKKYDYMPPFFPVSCVSGKGLDQLARFLSRLGRTAVHTRSIDPPTDVPSPLPPANGLEDNPANFFCDSPPSASSSDSDSISSHGNRLTKEDSFVSTVNSSLAATNRARNSLLICFWVNQVFEHIPGVPDPVLYGKIQSGQLNVNQFAWLGPDQFGEFHLVRVVSLMHNRLPHSVVYAGQTASVAVHFIAGSTLDYDSDRKVKTQPDHPAYNGHRQYYKGENDENVPKDTDPASSPNSSTSTTPVILRRGMVLISHQSWSTNYGSLLNLDNPLPFRLPRCIGVNSSVGVAWTVGLALTHLLPASPTVSGSPAALPTLPLPNQQVTVYAGCVAQSAVVLAEEPGTGPKFGEHSNNAHITVRFVRRPEYLEVNRRIILTWASCAKAVGYISSLHDMVTRERPFSCSNLDSDGTKSDLFSYGEQPVEALRPDPNRPLRGAVSLPSAISRPGHLDDDRILPTRFPLRHRQTDDDACSGGDGNPWITSPDLTLPSSTLNRLILEDPRTSAKLALLNEDSPEDDDLTPADVQSEHLIAVDGSELDPEIRRDESSSQSYKYTRRRRRHQSDVF